MRSDPKCRWCLKAVARENRYRGSVLTLHARCAVPRRRFLVMLEKNPSHGG